MDPGHFRGDPWLRSSGYHLATWSLVALVLDLRRAAPSGTGAAGAILLVAAAVLTSLTHERRIGKMAGPALVPVWDRAGQLWWSLLAGFVAIAVPLVTRGHGEWLVPVGLVLVGTGHLVWSRCVRMSWLAVIGAAAVAAALVDAAATASGQAPLALRALVLGVVLPAAGLWTSRRYLWFR